MLWSCGLYPLWIRNRPVSEPDPIIYKQVMGIYLPGTERLDPKYLRVDRYPDPDPTRFETNKYMDQNSDPNTFRVRVQI